MRLREFRAADAPPVNLLALAAFEQFKVHYSDWPAMAVSVGRMATLAENGEIILAEHADKIIGAVAYVAPRRSKTVLLRCRLADHPHAGGGPRLEGLGSRSGITEECFARARRNASPSLLSTPVRS
jgi:hypothetical protein